MIIIRRAHSYYICLFINHNFKIEVYRFDNQLYDRSTILKQPRVHFNMEAIRASKASCHMHVPKLYNNK